MVEKLKAAIEQIGQAELTLRSAATDALEAAQDDEAKGILNQLTTLAAHRAGIEQFVKRIEAKK